jgi:D-alanyl-D-alanine carboxypeptidase (penicillin-binding protein 5/6)
MVAATGRVRPCLLAFALLGTLATFPARAQVFQTAAPYAILFDTETRSVLFERQADEPMVPASMVKLMTAEVVFHELANGRLKMDDEFVVSENAWRRGGAPSRGSSMFAALNSRVKISDLLLGLITASGNDAAIVLAEGIAGSESAFVKMMTERAQAIGLKRSTFANSTGFHDPRQKMSARDLAMLADHIIRTYPEEYRIFGVREMTWNRVRQEARNPLLAMDIGADGLKTGNVAESGFGVVGSAVQVGQRLIVVVNGLKDARERAGEARKLLEWGFRSFEPRTLMDAGSVVAEVPVFGGASPRVGLVLKTPARLLVPRGAVDRMSARVVYKGPLVAPVAAGTPVGTLRISRGDVLALEVPVHAEADVAEGGLMQRAMDALWEQGTAWVRRQLSRG